MFLFLCSSLYSAPSLKTLYATLDSTSVAQHFAFYELYPKTPEGRQALKHAWELLSGGCADCDPELVLPNLDIQPIRIKAGEPTLSRSAGTVSELPVRKKARWRRSKRDFFPIVHNGTVEI